MTRKAWSWSFGRRGCKVRVYEDPASGIIYGGEPRRSLGHRDRDLAKTWCKAQVAAMLNGRKVATDRPAPPATLAHITARYLNEKTPDKAYAGAEEQDKREAELWVRVLGAGKDLAKLTTAEWSRFIRERSSGAITSRGVPVPDEAARVPVRDGTVREDLIWLKTLVNWAMNERDAETGAYLLPTYPFRGNPESEQRKPGRKTADPFAVPKEENPRRPVADAARFEAILKVAPQVTMEIRRDHKRLQVPSYLPELLALAFLTGRRVSPILALRYADLSLGKTPEEPYGAIIWPAATDKKRKVWRVAMSPKVRDVIDGVLTARPTIGEGILFPSPRNPAKPVGKDLASAWLERAEVLAELPKMSGSLWHAYRRGWATLRKHLPDADVMAAGGWSDPTCLKACYQQADPVNVRKVIEAYG
jgi:integrase